MRGVAVPESQIQNFRLAIRRKNAEIEKIKLICSQPLQLVAASDSMEQLIEKRLDLQDAVAKLEEEVKRLEFEEADRNFRWEGINQQLLSAKTHNIAEQMSKCISDGRRRIEFECARLGNSAAFPVRWFDFMEKIADERARRIYQAHRETWTQQNQMITPSFIRSIRDRVISRVFAATKSSVVGDIESRARRTSTTVNSGFLSEWSRRIDRLVTRWNRDLEAEAIAVQYGAENQQKAGAKSDSPSLSDEFGEEQVGEARDEPAVHHQLLDFGIPNQDRLANSGAIRPGMYQSLPSTWNEFYQAFKALSDEEVVVALRDQGDQLLRAYVDYHDPNLRYGDVQFGGGITETFKARYEVLAISAGRKLSANSLDGLPLNVWLYHLFHNLVQSKSDLLFAPSKTGAIITRVCEASALYCLRLQAKALEDQTSGMDNKTNISGKSRRSGPLPRRAPEFVEFAGVLWGQSKGSSRKVNDQALLEIAARLDEGKFLPPTKYLESKCAKELKSCNSKNANSKCGPVMTWSRLVQMGDKDFVRGMRRMLSRCASKTK